MVTILVLAAQKQLLNGLTAYAADPVPSLSQNECPHHCCHKASNSLQSMGLDGSVPALVFGRIAQVSVDSRKYRVVSEIRKSVATLVHICSEMKQQVVKC